MTGQSVNGNGLGFIFDLDGTIVDSTAHYRATWQEFIQEFGTDDDPDKFVRTATRENLTHLLGADATPDKVEQEAARHAPAAMRKCAPTAYRRTTACSN